MSEDLSRTDEQDAQKGQAALAARAVIEHLMSAGGKGDMDQIQAILDREKSAHDDLDVGEIISQYKDGNGRTVLHFAAHGGHVQVVNSLLDTASDAVNLQDGKGDTPLTLAVAGGHGRVGVVNALLKRGADPNKGRADGPRALHHAAGHNDVDVVRKLLEAGADCSVQSAETGNPLHWAAGQGAKNALQVLINAGADVNAPSGQGLPPLILAAAHGCGSCVAALAKAGADVGHILGGNLTAMHMIAEYGSVEGVKAILDTPQGRQCAVHESDNGKPIHLAAWGGHRDVVELLLPHSEVKESVDELMAAGAAKAAQYAEDQKADGRVEGFNGGTAVGAPVGCELPPPPAGQAEVDEAMRVKEEANARFVAKDFQGARDLYTAAIELNGRDAVFWSNRAGCYMKLGEYEEALNDAEMARTLKPDWPKACYRMAEARLALRRYEDAALAAYEGIQLDGSNEALHNIMKTAIELGRREHRRKQQQQQQEAKA